tara:strand:+ start:92 stop:694 length:603 start_codon:yes stop_codon:yes gene_type:complete
MASKSDTTIKHKQKSKSTKAPSKRILKEIKRQAMFGKNPNKFINLIKTHNVNVNTIIGGKTLLRWVLWGAYNYSHLRKNYIRMANFLIVSGANYHIVNGGKTDYEHILSTESITDDFSKIIYNNEIKNNVSSILVTKRREMESMDKWADKNIMEQISSFLIAKGIKTRKRKRKKKGKRNKKKSFKKKKTRKKNVKGRNIK